MIRGIPWHLVVLAIIAGIATYFFSIKLGSKVDEAFSLGFITGFLWFYFSMTRYYLGLTYDFKCSNYLESVFIRGVAVRCDRLKFPHKNHRNRQAEKLRDRYGEKDFRRIMGGGK